jgi:hypothetical protein
MNVIENKNIIEEIAGNKLSLFLSILTVKGGGSHG